MNPNKITQFFKVHEKLIITMIVSVVLWAGYTRLINYLEHSAELQATASQIALQAQIDTNKALAAEVRQVRLDYETLRQEYEAKNRALEARITQRSIVVEKQQEKDKTLQPTELAGRWTELIALAPETITPNATGYQADPMAAIETVIRLETLPQLAQDLQDTRQIVKNKDMQIDALAVVADKLTKQVDGLNIQIEKQETASKDQIALVKAQARKSKFRWFIAGVVVGAAARGIVKVATGF